MRTLNYFVAATGLVFVLTACSGSDEYEFDGGDVVPDTIGELADTAGDPTDLNVQELDATEVEEPEVDVIDVEAEVVPDGSADAGVETCGNGVLDGGEACDGALLAGTNCGDLGFASGVLGCTDECTRDTSACAMEPGPLCNDGVREGDEECDTEDVGDATCDDLGFFGTGIGCASDCTLTEGACRVVADCGDGFIDGDEACDDANEDSDDGCSAECAIEDCYADIRLTWYVDNDGDGVGSGDPIASCLPPVEGAVNITGDCDDDDADRTPGAVEICDGIDNNCNDSIDDSPRRVGEACSSGLEGVCAPGSAVCVDGELLCASNDPGSDEVCDEVDNDCDGLIDEGADGLELRDPCYAGPEGTSGVGVCIDGARTCNSGIWSACVGAIVPDTEFCDGLDNNCDGLDDNDVVFSDWYVDLDGDGQGDADSEPLSACAPPEGYADNADDCDDSDETIYVGAEEECNGVDDNCDERIDNDAVDIGLDCETGVLGVCAPGLLACDAGERVCLAAVSSSAELCNGLDDDCDGEVDEIAPGVPLFRACYNGSAGTLDVGTCRAGTQTCTDSVYGGCVGQVVPGAELCDELDNDCDGVDDNDVSFVDWFRDGDGDGFGAGTAINACVPPNSEYVRFAGDCNDGVDTIYPRATETLNGTDDDCDGFIDETTSSYDDDGDGFCEVGPCTNGLPDGDCDDNEPRRAPGLAEVVDGIDNDCDGTVDNRTPQLDDDGDGYCEVGPCITGALGPGDCNDDDPTIYPGAEELDNGIDDNCNGVPDDRKTWLGGAATDPTAWSTAANWIPVGVPTSADEVYIPLRANQPRLTANGVALSVTLATDAELNLNGFNLTVGADVAAGDAIVGAGSVIMTGASALLEGTLSNLEVRGVVSLMGNVNVTGNMTITDTGTVFVAGSSLQIDGAFTQTMRVGGGLRLLESDDEVVIGGLATFGMAGSPSVDAQGAMTAGSLTLLGNFTQTDAGSPTTKFAFAPSGTRVRFAGSALQTVAFESPGTGLSHLGDVEVSNPLGVSLSAATYFRTLSLVSGGGVAGNDAHFFGALPAVTPAYVVVRTHVSGDVTTGAAQLVYDVAALVVDAGATLRIGTDGMDLRAPLTSNGTVLVEGNELTIAEVFTHAAGTVRLGSGQLIAQSATTIAGPGTLFDVDGGRFDALGALTVTWNPTGPQGLYLDGAADDVRVYGTATFTTPTFSASSSAAALTNGTIRFYGNFVQTLAMGGGNFSFQSNGTRVLFAGSTPQTVRFDSPGAAGSRFDDVEFANAAGVTLTTGVWVSGELLVSAGTLGGADVFFTAELPEATGAGVYAVTNTHCAASFVIDDAMIETPNLIVDAGVTTLLGLDTQIQGPVVVRGSFDLDGNVADLAGNLTIDAGALYVRGGVLLVDGATVLGGTTGTLNIGGGVATLANYRQNMAGSNNLGLVMINAADDVTVLGAFVSDEENFYAGDTATAFTSGTLRLRGNVTHVGGTGSNQRGFAPVGTLVRLEGTSAQTVSLIAHRRLSRASATCILRTAMVLSGRAIYGLSGS